MENVALLYAEEKHQNETLQKEVESLSKQLKLRNYTTRKGFSQLRCNAVAEFLASKLPSSAQISPDVIKRHKTKLGEGTYGSITIGNLTSVNVDVAIKESKGSSLDVEGRVYQALSGSKNFLHFFGVLDNCLILEIVQVYDPKQGLCCSNTLSFALDRRVYNLIYNWVHIASGIVDGVMKMHSMGILHNDLKENNILLKETTFEVTPKIFDFGKATHVSHPLKYDLTNNEKKTI